jgi:hypothetical protein
MPAEKMGVIMSPQSAARGSSKRKELRREIGRYQAAMKRLYDDLDMAIHDAQFRVQGGNIIRAVDFTEINAFVLPQDDRSRFPIPTEQGDIEHVALDIATLNSLFFGRQGGQAPPVLLLPPYKLELMNAEGYFQQETLNKFRALAKQAEEELEKVRGNQELEEILTEIENPKSTDAAKSGEDRLLGFLNKNASNLLLLVTEDAGIFPTARLILLLKHSRLVDLESEEVVGRSVRMEELNIRLVQAIQERLTARRRESSERFRKRAMKADEVERLEKRSRRDARAIAYVLRTNDLLSSKKDRLTRVALLTRSEAFVESVRQYSMDNDLPRLAHFIRRSTATMAGLLQPGDGIQAQLERLKQSHRSIDLVLRRLESRPPHISKLSKMQSDIAQLRGLWTEAVNLAVASSQWNVDPSARRANLARVKSILRDHQQLSEAISVAAIELAADIALGNALLVRSIERPISTQVDIQKEEVPRTSKTRRNPAFVWVKRASTTLGLYFYHSVFTRGRRSGSDGVKLLERLLKTGPHRAISHEAEHYGIPAEHEPSLIETCLASCLLEATAEHWRSALTYAELAVNWDEKLDRTPKHEAYYMRAVCRLRARNLNESAIKQGIEDLDTALKVARDARGVEKDQRYILERGKHYFALWEYVDNANIADMDSGPGAAGLGALRNTNYLEAVRLFEKAKGLLEEERITANKLTDRMARQMVDIANARCYAHILSVGPDDTALHLLVELQRAIADCGWNTARMPIAILDTICWTMHRLGTKVPDKSWFRDAAHQLAKRFSEYTRSEDIRAVTERHLAVIEKERKFGLKW